MKKIVIAIVIIALGVAAFIVSRDKETNDGFNLVFRYGVGAKNELNTFKQTFKKDMVNKPSITIKMKLSDEELVGIHQKLNEVDLFNEISSYQQKLKKEQEEYEEKIAKWIEPWLPFTEEPCSKYYIKVDVNSAQKDIRWDCQVRAPKVKEFLQYMYRIIESQEEYQKSPTPKAGYL